MNPIYLDYNATTPTDAAVIDTMMPFFAEKFGNASSETHSYGWEASASVEKARKSIAKLIGARPRQLIFTSGATESNNCVFHGVARTLKDRGAHIVTSAIEHKCVLNSCRSLERDGFRVTYVSPDRDGLINPDSVLSASQPDTILISIMAANNEIGTLQPIRDIAALAQRENILFHTDAAQLVGKLPIDLDAYGIDFASLSGHKMYGPKGIGALYVRRPKSLAAHPLIHGGGQEFGLRSGTLNVPGIVGFGKAAQVALEELGHESLRVAALKESFVSALTSRFENIVVNGHSTQALPGCVNLQIPGVEATQLMRTLQNNVAFSSGSACASSDQAPSHVLSAIGLGESDARCSIRVGFGRYTTQTETTAAISHMCGAIAELLARNASVSAA